MNNNQERPNQNDQKKSGTPLGKRIAALVCVFLLLSLYVVTLLVAIFDKSSSGRWFMACMIGTIFLPILTWIYIWMYGVLTQKHTIASFDVRPKDADISEETNEVEKDDPAN